MNNNNNQLVKRKRGRPRKNEQLSELSKKPIDKRKKKKKEDDDLILHFPINLEELKKLNLGASSMDISMDMSPDITSSEISNKIFTITDLSYSDSDDDIYDEYLDNSEIIGILRKKDNKITELTKELDELKALLNDDKEYGINLRKVYKLNFNFINSVDGKILIDESTDISCWWCTEQFNNPPCFLPEKFINNTFYVFGCFCSFNCASSYNISMDDYKVSERDSLIHKIYHEITGGLEKIKIAPPREALKKFGGPLDIVTFRKNCQKLNKDYRLIMQPMTTINPLIEEGVSDASKFKKLQLSKSDGMVLKRTKKLQKNRNNLVDTINKIKEKQL